MSFPQMILLIVLAAVVALMVRRWPARDWRLLAVAARTGGVTLVFMIADLFRRAGAQDQPAAGCREMIDDALLFYGALWLVATVVMWGVARFWRSLTGTR